MPNGQAIRYQYDNLGKLEKVTHPDGTRETMLYDLNQNLVQTINRRFLSTLMTYNDADVEITRTTKDLVRGDTVVTTSYTAFGPAKIAVTEGANAIVETDLEYHWSGQVSLRKQVSDGHTMKVAYAYDALGNRTSMTPTGSGSSAWTQQLDILSVFHASTPDADHFNRTAIADHASGDHFVTIEPDYAGLTSVMRFGDFASPVGQMSYTYDRYLRPVTIQTGDSPKSLELSLARDFSGNIIAKNEPAWNSVPAVADSYAYDGMNRLVNGEGDENTFDELSNLVVKGPAKYRYEDPDDPGQDQMRLEAFNDDTDHAYTYDADGNITAIGSRFSSLSYDNLGKLREIVWTQTDQYWCDQAGLRIKRTEDSTGTPVTTYTMYEGNNPLMQEVYEGSTRKAVWFQILVGEQILARVGKNYPSTGVTFYFALDNLGSRRAVFDATGTLVNRYRYSAWGVATQDSGTDNLASFTGKDYDATGLLYFNARYYDSLTGRFLSEDPARKGSGWYSYCDGNPVNATDPTGLVDEPNPIDVFKALVGAFQTKANLEAAASSTPFSRTASAAQTVMNGPSLATLNKVGQFVNHPAVRKTVAISAGVMQTLAGVGEVAGSVGLFAAIEAGTAGGATPASAPLAFAGVSAGVLTTTLGFVNTMQALSDRPAVSPASSLFSGVALASGASPTTANTIGFFAGMASSGYGTFGLPGNRLFGAGGFVLGTMRDGLPWVPVTK